MDITTSATSFAALGHPARLSVFRLLMRHAPRGVRPTELCQTLAIKPNTMSHHLADLERAGLVQAQRQGRSILYAVDLKCAGDLLRYLADDCCRARPDICGDLGHGAITAAGRALNVLFICTGNSARSILAEAVLRHLGPGRFHAFSAGTRPAAHVNPKALDLLTRAGIATTDLHAKHIAAFETPGAPVMDFVFTVCDAAASEECAPWAGHPMTAHWGIADPARAVGDDTAQAAAFERAYGEIHRRVAEFAKTPLDRLDRTALQHHLDHIGRLPA